MTDPTLPPVPCRAVDPSGAPLFGTYEGVLADASFVGLAPAYSLPALRRMQSEKAWHFVCLHDRLFAAGFAIVRLGYMSSAFAFLFDRSEREFLVEESVLGPPLLACKIADAPGTGAHSTFRVPGFHCSVMQPAGHGRIELRTRITARGQLLDLAADLATAGAPAGLTAICPIGGQGALHLTVKQVCLPARARLVLGDEEHVLGPDALGLIDYSHGLLDRTTSWMWAAASGQVGGQPVGFNLAQGFTAGTECAIWIGEHPQKVGPVQFRREPGPLGRWWIATDDGRLSLTFTPEGSRSDNKDVGPITSHYLQALGTFSGNLCGFEVADLFGLTEEHHARW